MTTGERILQARQAAGLSQRQLAGNVITRNMLSLLEHDQANPSLETLRYLSRRLQRPVSYFLGEDTALIPGMEEMRQARQAFSAGEYARCLSLIGEIPDGEVLLPERETLWAEATLCEAEQALRQGKKRYCRTLLERGQQRLQECPYGAKRQWERAAVLLAEAAQSPQELTEAVRQIPDPDRILMVQALAALQEQQPERAAALLDAAGNQESARWAEVRGDAQFALGDYEGAAQLYHRAEQTQPRTVRRRLQLCYAKLRNFEKAYEYATMEAGEDDRAELPPG